MINAVSCLVIETHPDNELPDLRLDKPFPEIINFCNSINLNEMNKKDHSHVAYLIILYKYLEIWKTQVYFLSRSLSINILTLKIPE